jgi:hypothetical protein
MFAAALFVVLSVPGVFVATIRNTPNLITLDSPSLARAPTLKL